jgi:hypothetical protein
VDRHTEMVLIITYENICQDTVHAYSGWIFSRATVISPKIHPLYMIEHSLTFRYPLKSDGAKGKENQRWII